MELKKTDGITLMKAFPGINTGIFNFFGDSPAWSTICDDVVMNNTLFFTFGKRIAAPVLTHFMFNDKTPLLPEDCLHTIDDNDANVLAQMILARYGEKWNRMLAINDADYNPLNNYDMTEKEIASTSGLTQDANTSNRSNTRAYTTSNELNSQYGDTRANTSTYSANDINNSNASTANNETEAADADTSIYAFNSADAVPANESGAKTVKSSSGLNKAENSITSNNKSASSESVTGKREEAGKRLESESGVAQEASNSTITKNDATTRTLTRSGNIGVTTSVQMLTQERNFWTWSYIRTIIEDVAAFLTIGVY